MTRPSAVALYTRPVHDYTHPPWTGLGSGTLVQQGGRGVTGLPSGAVVGPIPPDEAQRIAAVRRYDILDTPPDGAFDRIAMLAARVLDTPIATVTIVDEDRIWFKAGHGLQAVQIDRVPGLCASVILQDDCYVVTDALTDPRTASNPLVLGELGLRFYAAAPLISSDGYRLGTLNVIDHRPRSITEEQTATLQDLASVVVDELELRLAARKIVEAKAEVERLGDALQRSVLPPVTPAVPSLDLAGYYQPARGGLEICGDFYDVFESRPGTWVMVIGDVCGRGVDAAVMMGVVRHRLRALAEAGHPPAEVIARLNDSLAKEEHQDKFCTLCYLEIRPQADRVRITMSTGGHPSPLLRRPGKAVAAVGQTGPLVGAFPGAKFADHATELASGDLLLLYTDGMVEGRSQPAIVGEERLRSALAQCPPLGAAEALAGICQAVPPAPEGEEDDRAMLLVRVV
jgi:sigma-B regulation protein RsbU (phosphoserine phosphatase)